MATSRKTTSKKPVKRRKIVAKKKPPAVQIRTSERSLWKDCRKSWDWCYNDRLKPIQEKPALAFGTLIHEALEERYPPGIRRGPHPRITFEKKYEAFVKKTETDFNVKVEDEWQDMGELGVDMMNRFVDLYGKDEEWKVIKSEMTFRTPVYSPEHPDGTGGYMNLKGERIPKRVVLFYYVGTMDNVLQNRMSGSIFINDWKTTGNDPIKEGAGKGVLDEQATAYWTWGVDYLIEKKIMKPRQLEQLDGMMYTFLRKAKKDTRPQDSNGYYRNQPTKKQAEAGELGDISKNQPLAYFHRELVYRSEAERENARQRATQEAYEMAMARDGRLGIYKTPATGSMGHCGWCGYRDICELHEAGADWETLRDSTMTTWDPYAAHEIEEEGKAR